MNRRRGSGDPGAAPIVDRSGGFCETPPVAEPPTYKVRLTNGTEFGPAAMDLIVQWAQEGRVPRDAVLVPGDGGGPPRPVIEVEQLTRLVQAPPVRPGTLPPPASDGPMSGMIPYRNPPALVGYYLAVFSLVPLLGLALGLPAVICGAFGLRKGIRTPGAKGKVHALVAIILGTLTSVGYLALLIAILAGTT